MTNLTQENYYKDTDFLSFSRYKRYLECEAKAYASDFWNYDSNTDNTALLVGNYVHSYFESEEAHKKFTEDNKDELLAKTGKNKGGLKSNFLIAENMIDTLKDDDNFKRLYHGYSEDKIEKEMIVTGEIEGVPFKGKLDSVNLSRGYFVDLKTMKSIYSEEYNRELRQRVPAVVNNILNYKYHGQLAVYRELLKQTTGTTFRPIIVAVSKESIPDKEIVRVDEEWLSEAFSEVTNNIKHVWDVINGVKKPKRCGRCDYCRSTKRLTGIVSMNDLIGSE